MTERIIREMIVRAKRDGGVTVDVQKENIIESLDEWCLPRWPDITTIVGEKRLEPALMEFVASHKRSSRTPCT